MLTITMANRIDLPQNTVQIKNGLRPTLISNFKIRLGL